MFDLSMPQALGRCPVEFIDPKDRPRYLENFAKRKAGRPEPYFLEFHPPGRETHLIFVHVQTYQTPTGSFEGSLALMFDVTKAFAERMVSSGGHVLRTMRAIGAHAGEDDSEKRNTPCLRG